jgi:hypothetical protein
MQITLSHKVHLHTLGVKEPTETLSKAHFGRRAFRAFSRGCGKLAVREECWLVRGCVVTTEQKLRIDVLFLGQAGEQPLDAWLGDIRGVG